MYVLIKFFELKDRIATEIEAELDLVYVQVDAVPSFMTVKIWATKFNCGRTTIFDGKRSRHPKTVTMDKMIN